MDRLSREAEEKRQAAAAAEQKRKAAEKAAAEKAATEKAAAEKAAVEKAAVERAAAERAAAERTQNLQNQSIPSGHSIAATAWSAWHIRVYFQDGRGGVRESRHDDGVWSGGDARSVLFTAKMGTPLSVISWDNGQQIRIYYLSSQDMLQEHCYSAGHGWYHGNLNNQWIRVAPSSKISAIHWHVDTSIRVYFQGKSLPPASCAIQEYCYCGRSGWCRGATLWNARPGSSIAATRWFSGALDSVHRNLHIRIYYQDEQSYIRELCWQVGGWSKGGYSQWALGGTPIAAFAWHDYQVSIRVFWQDNYRALFESKYVNGWSGASSVANDVDERCHFTAVELQNGQHYRVYVRDRTALIEKCNGRYGGYWFNGVFVIR
ncbi:fucose-specific lectin [Byssothecium circinans]|uniref:Fucose-specific lectin n=1 Tax=Byssothecium circinans TaxID=147558 RepID=A0A6A5TRT2_9PLEO|nr:fucose-specific lectin [Byssothecium circinans]